MERRATPSLGVLEPALGPGVCLLQRGDEVRLSGANLESLTYAVVA